MRWFRLLWLLHRWLGVTAGLVLLVTAATGFLLLVPPMPGPAVPKD